METPSPITTKRSLNQSSSKSSSLTPCRRLGLGRPSTGSLNKKLHTVRTLSSSAEKTGNDSENQENKAVDETIEVANSSLKNKLKLLKDTSLSNENNAKKARRSLNVNLASEVEKLPVTNYDYPAVDSGKGLNSDMIETERLHNKKFDDIHSDLGFDNSEMSEKVIQQLVLSIKEKKKKLEELKVQDSYAKKHNLDELRQQNVKWKTAGQEALRYFLSLARQAGVPVTLKQLMAQHGFLPHLMDYSSEDDDFI